MQLQVGYWKDLLELVKMCVSPEDMKQRAQQAIDNKLAVAEGKHKAKTKDDKVSDNTHLPT